MQGQRGRQIGVWLGLAAACAILDQFSKAVVMASLPFGSSTQVSSFFNLVYVLNPGAAFSLLASAPGWQRWFFSILALVVSILLIALIARKPSDKEVPAYALILGGAVGNLIDRVRHGAVVDWLDFHVHGMHWPAFNLADVWIVTGAAFMVLASFRPRITNAPSDIKNC